MEVACLVEPYTYLQQNQGGKGFRNRLLFCFNKYYELTKDELLAIQEVVDMLHNASLLIDDIEDGSHWRRGKRCAHELYGIPGTINAGNMMYFEAMKKLLDLGGNESTKVAGLSRLFADSMVKLHIGQGKEIYWRDHGICPSEKEYLEMVVGKTGELFKLGVKMMSIISRKNDTEIDDKLEEFCDVLGMYYQIQNDIDGLTVNSRGDSDLDEGKLSFPILYCVHRGVVTVELIQKCPHMDTAAKKDLVTTIMTTGGGSAYAETTLRGLRAKAESLMRSANVSTCLLDLLPCTRTRGK